jgi:hypothetical protein
MSYNITNWKTKEIKDFCVPLDDIYDLPDVSVELFHNGPVIARCVSEGFKLVGILNSNNVIVDLIESYGESSGSSWDSVLDLFHKSSGRLTALVVWEGGDTITRLVVDSGIVIEENID